MNPAEEHLKEAFFKSSSQGEELDEEIKAALTLMWLAFKKDKESYEFVLLAMHEYSKEACQEQREICYRNASQEYYGDETLINKDSIINAPLPELK